MDVVGVGMGIKDGIDVGDFFPQGLLPEVGRGVNQDIFVAAG